MIVFIISIIAAIAGFVISKKKGRNNFELVKQILWVEASIFAVAYVCTDKFLYRKWWLIFMILVGVFIFVDRWILKRKE